MYWQGKESLLFVTAVPTMAIRKLLIVTYYFPPSAESGAFRMLGFARHLSKFGWEPIVVAAFGKASEPVDRDLLSRVKPEASVHHVHYPQGRLARAVARYYPYQTWLPKGLAECARCMRRYCPDALLTSSPPHCVHLLGIRVKHRWRIPWVADFRDPWVADENPPSRPLYGKYLAAFLEKKVMKNADVVVANAPLACQTIQDAYPAYTDKMISIPNGYDPESFVGAGARLAGDRPLRIVHAGELYDGRDPRPLLHVLKTLQQRPDFRDRALQVRFLGRASGDGFDFQAEIERLQLGTIVQLCGQVSYRQVLQELLESDILLLLDRPGRRIGVPAKLYEYLGARRPILALAERDGDMAWVLRESRVPYRIAAPSDTTEIAQALAELIHDADNRSGLPMMQPASLDFTRERMAQRLAEALDPLIRNRENHNPTGQLTISNRILFGGPAGRHHGGLREQT
jgi:glycosyltransferase involved in cell wall biosynthesis